MTQRNDSQKVQEYLDAIEGLAQLIVTPPYIAKREAAQKKQARIRQQIADLLQDGKEWRPVEIALHFGLSVAAVTEALRTLLEANKVTRSERIDIARVGNRGQAIFYRKAS